MSILGITREMLTEWQSWSIERKIEKSKQTIKAWYEHYDGHVYVSFSGGKDSSVMLHLVRSMYPDVPAVFSNTGLEFPEIVAFVKSQKNVEIIRPKMTSKQVIEKHGFPIISKEQAQYINQARNAKSKKTVDLRMNGREGQGRSYAISLKWLKMVKAPFEVTEKCCDELKKKPFKLYEKNGRKPFVGTMAGESMLRLNSYIRYGCNAFDATRPQSRPLGHWLDSDIWDYIACFNVPYCEKIYKDMGYKRTGCVWCGFGVHMEKGDNRFQKLQVTHPKLHKYACDVLGFRKALNYIGVDVDAWI